MYIDPVNPEFEYLRVRRTGGFIGVDQALQVDRDMRARVTDRRAGDRVFMLDAWCAQELMEALAAFATKRPAPSPTKGCDMFSYDIELGYGGTVIRIKSVDIGADEALHGVMLAAHRLIEHGGDDHVHQMILHTSKHGGAALAEAGTG